MIFYGTAKNSAPRNIRVLPYPCSKTYLVGLSAMGVMSSGRPGYLERSCLSYNKLIFFCIDPSAAMITRNITRQIVEALADTPVIMVNGARQTGKSILVKSLLNEKQINRYVTPDDPTTIAAAKHDPEAFLSGLGESAAIDEIQRAPELFLAIKADVDRNRTPGRYLRINKTPIVTCPAYPEKSLINLALKGDIPKRQHGARNQGASPGSLRTSQSSCSGMYVILQTLKA